MWFVPNSTSNPDRFESLPQSDAVSTGHFMRHDGDKFCGRRSGHVWLDGAMIRNADPGSSEKQTLLK